MARVGSRRTAELGQWQARALACHARLDQRRGQDCATRLHRAAALCHLEGITDDAKVTGAAALRIRRTRQLVVDYAAQHRLADPGTALVDAGWTGRMAGALVRVCEQAGMSRPNILFWGH